MFGNHPGLNPLASRKQLLIAESELNRAQMVAEIGALAADVRALTHRAKTFGSIASGAALLIAGISAFRRGKSVFTGSKPSWLQTILKGASTISSLWLAFRSRGDRKEKQNHDKRKEREESIGK